MEREICAQELETGNTRGCGKHARLVDICGIVTPQKVKHPVESAHGKRASFIEESLRKRSATGTRARNARGKLFDFYRRLFGKILVDNATLAFSGDGMLSYELLAFGIDNSDPEPANVDDDSAAGVLRGCMVIRAIDFDKAVEVHGAFADAVILEPS